MNETCWARVEDGLGTYLEQAQSLNCIQLVEREAVVDPGR